jgi:hypothetical protein
MGRGALLGIALVLAFASGAHGRSMTAISIAVTTGNQPLGGLVYATYGSPATVAGVVDGAQAGTGVVLQANVFPFTSGFSTVGQATTGNGGAYTFSPKPSLATQYRVALASDSTSMSAAATVYVTSRGVGVNPPCVSSGSYCTLHIGANYTYPSTVATKEGAKPQYVYLGVGYGTSVVHASRVTLRRTARQQRSGSTFRVRVAISFPTPGAPYHYNWVICAKDTEAADGLGLPGHHHCGDRSIPYPAFNSYVA